MKIEGLGSHQILNNVKEKSKEQNGSFGDLLKNFVIDVNNDLKNANIAKQKIVNGQVENLEQLMYQIGKADISLRLITEIRNKALESYQEIMRMQV